MADLATLEKALKKAHTAGDTRAAKMFADEIKKESVTPQPQSMAGGVMDRLARGAFFGLDDEMTALQAAILGQTPEGGMFDYSQPFGERYDRALAAERNQQEKFQEDHPNVALASEVAGGLMSGGGLARSGLTLMKGAKATLPSLIGRGAAEGAAYGAAYGAGTGEGTEDRVRRASSGVLFGGLTGGALGAAGSRTLRQRDKVPSLDNLRTMANQAYQKADDAGVIIAQPSFKRAVSDIQDAVANAGIDATIHPKAMAAMNRLLQATDENVTFKGAEILRRVAQNAAKSIEPDERRIARIITNKLDDYIGNLGQADVLTGDAKAASTAISEARGLWGRLRKGEIINDLMERAKNRAGQFSGSGYENALRTEFRGLAQNPKRMRGFSKEEQKVIRKVAQGGTVGNALRMLGKFAPHGIVSTTLGGGAGYALGGPLGMAALLGAGEVGRLGATALTTRNAARAGAMMRRGGPAASAQFQSPRQQLIEALMAGAAPLEQTMMDRRDIIPATR